MEIRFDFSDFDRNMKRIVDHAFPEAVEKGLGVATLQLLGDCVTEVPTVPIKEGWLRGSGSAFVQNKLAGISKHGKAGFANQAYSENIAKGKYMAIVGFNTPYAARMHEGIDFVLGCGEPIYAIQDGEVIFCGIAGDYGNTIIIQHDNGIRSYYCHCSKMFYKPKRFVEQGDAIGLVGTTGMSTGCHLHFAMKVGNEYVNPINFIGA